MAWKSGIRVLGFDDGPSQRGDPSVPIVGVVTRCPGYVEAVLRTGVVGDGDDATAAIAAAVEGYRGKSNLVALMVHNLMVAGFNIVDIHALHEATGIPVVAAMRGTPDKGSVRRALHAGVPNGPAKVDRYDRAGQGFSLRGRGWAWSAGLDEAETRALLGTATVRGTLPECLRLAHLIGAGWVLGQSKGQ